MPMKKGVIAEHLEYQRSTLGLLVTTELETVRQEKLTTHSAPSEREHTACIASM